MELVAVLILSVSLWHAAESGSAPAVSKLEISSSSCHGRNPVFHYLQMGYATTTTVTWDGSDAKRDCTIVETIHDWSNIAIGYKYKCEKENSCSATLKLRNGSYKAEKFHDCCNVH